MNDVSQILESHGIRPTQQRVRVAQVLLAAPTHMTADQLLAALKQSPSRVSKATVYNTLKLFVDHGLARQIHLDPDRCVYDSTMAPHHHFQNVETGEMLDIQPGRPRIREAAAAAGRHRDRQHRRRDPGASRQRLIPASIGRARILIMRGPPSRSSSAGRAIAS